MRLAQADPTLHPCTPIDPVLRRLSFQHLLCLRSLVEERSVSRAAQRMGMGQPSMSMALSRLRRAFRDELFVRGAKGIEPTDYAIELVQHIAGLCATLDHHPNPDATAPAQTDELIPL